MTSLPWAALHDMTQFHWVRQSYGPYDQFDYFSVIVIFILSALWGIQIRGLWKLSDWRDWLWRELGPVLMGRAMLSKCLIQFSLDGRGCVPALLFDLRPNYGGGNEDNGDLLQKVPCSHCHTQCPWSCCRLTPPGHSQASLGQSLVGSLLLSPRSCCAQGFVCALQESVSPVLCKSGGSMVRLMATSSKCGLCHTQVCCTQSPCPWSWSMPPQETLKHSKAGLTQSLWGLLLCTMFCLSPLSISGGNGIWF